MVCTFSTTNLADGPLGTPPTHMKRSVFLRLSNRMHLLQFFISAISFTTNMGSFLRCICNWNRPLTSLYLIFYYLKGTLIITVSTPPKIMFGVSRTPLWTPDHNVMDGDPDFSLVFSRTLESDLECGMIERRSVMRWRSRWPKPRHPKIRTLCLLIHLV